VQAQQHLRPLVAEQVDDRVVQAAIAGARVDRDEGQVERAEGLGDDVAAELYARVRRNRPLPSRGVVAELVHAANLAEREGM